MSDRELYRGTDVLMEAADSSAGADPFLRRYFYVLATVAVAALLWWLLQFDARVRELNDLLAKDTEVAAYPYKFQVLSLENGTASLSSPRSAQMSAIQGLRILFPELERESAVSPTMMTAQERLAVVQSRAGKLIAAQDDVQRIQWVLDERWLARHGVYVQ